IFSLLLAVIAWQDSYMLSAGSPTPTRMAVSELGAQGPGDNIHVTVTEFGFGRQYAILKEKGRWTRVYIPLLPPDGSKGIRVVVTTQRVLDQAQLARFVQQTTLTGIIGNDVPLVRSPGVMHLENSYPGVDFSQVLILEVDWTFPSPARLWTRVGAIIELFL